MEFVLAHPFYSTVLAVVAFFVGLIFLGLVAMVLDEVFGSLEDARRRR